MTTVKLPAPHDWDLSAEILDATMQAIDEKFHVSRAYHIPYLAGYSEGEPGSPLTRTIYIDHRMPDHFVPKDGGRTVKTDQYLVLHEAIEVTLEALEIPYQLRHQIALRVELAAVAADGVNVEEYNEFMAYWIDALEKEGYDDLPPDLDMTPYEDEEEFAHGHYHKFSSDEARE